MAKTKRRKRYPKRKYCKNSSADHSGLVIGDAFHESDCQQFGKNGGSSDNCSGTH